MKVKMTEDDIKCAHESCVCLKMQNSEYCCESCENAVDSDVTGVTCECGHAGCS